MTDRDEFMPDASESFVTKLMTFLTACVDTDEITHEQMGIIITKLNRPISIPSPSQSDEERARTISACTVANFSSPSQDNHRWLFERLKQAFAAIRAEERAAHTAELRMVFGGEPPTPHHRQVIEHIAAAIRKGE